MNSDLLEFSAPPASASEISVPPIRLSLPEDPHHPSPRDGSLPSTSPCPLVGANPANSPTATVPAVRSCELPGPPVFRPRAFPPAPQHASVFHPVLPTVLRRGPQTAAPPSLPPPASAAPPPTNHATVPWKSSPRRCIPPSPRERIRATSPHPSP